MSAPTRLDHQHVVAYYDSETFLVGTVVRFVGAALNDGDAAIVVATPAHRRAFDSALRTSGVDVAAAVAADRYLAFDARERLDAFMVGGAPDPQRFADMVGGAIDRATSGGRRVRIYGEIVAMLWAGGDVVSTIVVEDLWNDLATDRDFMLLCAYPMPAFADPDSGISFRRICDRHSTVIPSECYAGFGGVDVEQRVVAELQQEAAVFRAEMIRLREAQVVAVLDPGRDSTSPPAGPCRSPGGRLLVESLGTLSSRLQYAEEDVIPSLSSNLAQRSSGTARSTTPWPHARQLGPFDPTNARKAAAS